MKIILEKQVMKFIRKSEKKLQQKIKIELNKILETPFGGKFLKGNLSDLKSHKFFYSASEYRIIYVIENNVIIVMIGGRENLYKKL